MVTRHFPVWLMLGLDCLPAPGRRGVIRGAPQVPSPPGQGRGEAHGGDEEIARPPAPGSDAVGRRRICIGHPDLRVLRHETTIRSGGDVVLEPTR